MFFQTFWLWLTERLGAFISTRAAEMASAIEPVAAVLATIYVMVWGYLHLRGRIDEPIMEAAIRVLRLTVAFGVGLHLWLYHALMTEIFFRGPDELAARLVGAATPIMTIDTIWASGALVAAMLWDKGSVLSGDIGFYIAGVAVYILIGFCCVYTLFLLSLAKIAVSVLLAIGPLFIVLTLFESTRRYFDTWIQELANYALVSVVTVTVSALLLDFVRAYAEQTAARGEALVTVDALNLALAAALVTLVLRQVLPIAARLAGGFGLSTFGSIEQLTQRLRATALGAMTLAGAAAISSQTDDAAE
jgi:type IV secretion system protein VirB6